MERNLEEKAGVSPKFRFARTRAGFPAFEEFIAMNKSVRYAGKQFYLYGMGDGIMHYRGDDGKTINVGLELKTKQTTPARTSEYSMREPEESHVRQVTCYAEMYNVDYWIILYVNTAHKSWVMSEEDYAKTPDIRAFGLHVTDEMKADVFGYFVDIMESAEADEPLPLDVDKWLFNPYKTIIAEELTDEEIADLKKQRDRAVNSSLPEFKKRNYVDVVEFVEAVRNGESS
jgi:hypothetical protein